MSNPMDPLRTLKERTAEACAPLGLELQMFNAVVGSEGEPDHAQVIFTIDAERMGAEAEFVELKQEMEAELDEIQREAREKDLEQKVADAKANLENMLRRSRGDFLNPEG